MVPSLPALCIYPRSPPLRGVGLCAAAAAAADYYSTTTLAVSQMLPPLPACFSAAACCIELHVWVLHSLLFYTKITTGGEMKTTRDSCFLSTASFPLTSISMPIPPLATGGPCRGRHTALHYGLFCSILHHDQQIDTAWLDIIPHPHSTSWRPSGWSAPWSRPRPRRPSWQRVP
jgi:hypothetical protein